jgi:tellurite resistance protein
MIMGLSGLTIALQKASEVLDIRHGLQDVPAILTGILFVALASTYLLKVMRFRTAVLRELHDPVKLNFFPTVSISLLLLSVAFLSSYPGLARGAWLLGTAMHLLFSLYVLSVWIHHEHFEIHHLNPAWFIPVVGNVLVPIAGTQFGYDEISWFFFSTGILFWLVLFTIIFYRVLFHSPLQEKLMPTFFILIAPPAVGFISYVKLTGEIDSFARVLYYAGLFLALLLAIQVRRFARLKFSLSWWAYSFPTAAITIATMVMYQATAYPGLAALSLLLLSVLTAMIALLLYRTTVAILRDGICVPEN